MTRPRLAHGRVAAAVVALGLAAPVAAVDLGEVYDLALQNDPTYLAVGAGNRAAQELRPQARAALLPTIQFSGSTSGVESERRRPVRGTIRPSFNTNSMELSIAQPIYRKDLWIALGQANDLIRRSDIGLASARQSLMLRVASRYFAVLQAIDELSFARATLEAFQQQLTQSQQRFEVGLIAITDVEEAQAGYDRARADVILAENQLDTAREALREVTGEYHETLAPLGTAMPLVTPDPPDIEAWTRTALAQNLALAAAQVSTEVARDEIRRREAGHLPTLDLVASHQRNITNSPINLAPSDLWTSSIGLQLNVPIYQGGAVLSRTRESRHLHRQTLDELELARRAAQRQTRQAYLGVESGISRVQALEQAVRSAQSAKDAIEAGFQVGTRTTVDVLDAERAVFGARRDLAVARYGYIVDILSLKQAAGTLSEEDIELVNTWLER